jgi:hypothetical protein
MRRVAGASISGCGSNATLHLSGAFHMGYDNSPAGAWRDLDWERTATLDLADRFRLRSHGVMHAPLDENDIAAALPEEEEDEPDAEPGDDEEFEDDDDFDDEDFDDDDFDAEDDDADYDDDDLGVDDDDDDF